MMQPKPLKNLNSQTCQICGDTVGLTASGDVFVACNECAFPVCRPCYEYERKDGNQSCPQCKTRYKRHKGLIEFSCVFSDACCLDPSKKHSMKSYFISGSPRVDGDDDEDDVDDIENEFNYVQGSSKTKRQWHGEDAELSTSARHESQPIPLLTNGQSV